MIPTSFSKESGFKGNFPHPIPALEAPEQPLAHPSFVQNHRFLPENVVMQSNSEIDSLLQVHRRKMLRRAANRRSAQLSRARKKAYMEDLKIENARLQKMVDILDSQPELVFSVTIDGQITYMSERSAYFIKSSSSADESSDEDPTHMNQILTPESFATLLEAVREVSHGTHHNSIGNVHMEVGNGISAVREVCFHDASGYPALGYLRCAKVMRRAPLEESQVVDGTADHVHTAKRSKRGDDGNMSGESSSGCRQIASSTADATLATAAILQSLQSMSSSAWIKGGGKSEGDGRESGTSSAVKMADLEPEEEHEFVCVIRPADASLPQGSATCFQPFSTTLSTASMVQHDRDHVTKDAQRTERGGSPSDSSHSNSSNSNRSTNKSGTTSGSSSGNSNKNGTSSETGSDDTGENENDSV